MRRLTPGTSRPWRIAHRGASAEFPENTIAAFDAALKHPVDAVELDVQLSHDGVPVLWHDRTLGKAGAPRRRVTGMTMAELARLDAGTWFGAPFKGERIPTLEAVLDRYGERMPLMIEVKLRGGRPCVGRHRFLATRVAAMLRERNLLKKCFVLSFGRYALEAALSEEPSVRCIWNIRPRPKVTAAFERKVAPLFGVCLRDRRLTPAFVARLHALGKPVLTYTVNDEAALGRVRALGVDGVISDRAEWLCRALPKR